MLCTEEHMLMRVSSMQNSAAALTRERYRLRVFDGIRMPITIGGVTTLVYITPSGGYCDSHLQAENQWIAFWERKNVSTPATSD